jgi:hypothetical protein
VEIEVNSTILAAAMLGKSDSLINDPVFKEIQQLLLLPWQVRVFFVREIVVLISFTNCGHDFWLCRHRLHTVPEELFTWVLYPNLMRGSYIYINN